jgi:hypothetical protein
MNVAKIIKITLFFVNMIVIIFHHIFDEYEYYWLINVLTWLIVIINSIIINLL